MSSRQHPQDHREKSAKVKPAPSQSQEFWEQEQTVNQIPDLSPQQLPNHATSRRLGQQAMLQLQRSRGNSFVMRQVMPTLQRENGDDSGVPTEIASDGNRVSTQGGGVHVDSGGAVDVSGPTINLNAALIEANGVLRASTIFADSVISSTYSPGVGNIM